MCLSGCWVRVRVTTRCKGQVLICLLNACYYLFVFFNFWLLLLLLLARCWCFHCLFLFLFHCDLRAGSSPFVDGVKWFQLGLVSFFFSFSFRSPNSVLNRQIQHKFPRKNVEIYFLFSENKKMAETNLI